MEMADGIIINKADGNNIEKAKLAAAHFRNALHLFPAPESGWTPQVLTYSGFYGIGIKEIWDMVYSYIDFVKKNGYFDYRRNEQAKYWMYETINELCVIVSTTIRLSLRCLQLRNRRYARKGYFVLGCEKLLDTYFGNL